jgi:hypothetical protein
MEKICKNFEFKYLCKFEAVREKYFREDQGSGASCFIKKK